MIQKELRTRVVDSLQDTGNWTLDECRLAQDAIDSANIDQLWALYKLSVERKEKIRFLRFDPADHIAITFASMYVAILPDGSTHT